MAASDGSRPPSCRDEKVSASLRPRLAHAPAGWKMSIHAGSIRGARAQASRNAGKGAVDPIAEGRGAGDDCRSDESGDEAVFDRGGAPLVPSCPVQKRKEPLSHGYSPVARWSATRSLHAGLCKTANEHDEIRVNDRLENEDRASESFAVSFLLTIHGQYFAVAWRDMGQPEGWRRRHAYALADPSARVGDHDEPRAKRNIGDKRFAAQMSMGGRGPAKEF